jgi:uncharacterized protein Smg (DUF494 family)
VSEDRDEPVFRLLQLLSDHLESFLEGDETALETLGESIEERGFSADELHAAILLLRSFRAMRGGAERATWDDAPGKRALRVPSAEERDYMSPEAWGYLLELKEKGSLNPEQFERVLDLLSGSGVRPVGVEMAKDAATRVALDFDLTDGLGEMRHGDFDLAH